jgi:hypothetical protein
MAVKRRRYGTSGHGYTVDGQKVPGVTSILKMLPNDALIGWAGRVTAEYTLDHWAELAEMAPSTRLKTMTGARFETLRTASKRGTDVHRLAEGLVAGEAVTVPEELAGHVEAYRDWLDAVEPVPVATELVVAHRIHRYCGTADLVADLPGLLLDDGPIPAARWLLELKTTASGVWPESALQATAYSRAEVYVHPEHPDDEQPMSLLGIERCGVVWIKSDTCELRPVDTSEELWDFFVHLRWLYDRMEIRDSKPVLPGTWIGPPAELAELVPNS